VSSSSSHVDEHGLVSLSGRLDPRDMRPSKTALVVG
jgi:hypothetical protein